MLHRFLAFAVLILLGSVASFAQQQQRAEVSLALDEQFFSTFLDAVFQNYEAPAFRLGDGSGECGKLKILREGSGVRTAAHFRNGRITAPIVFAGNYAPPFVGCVEFSGYADTVIDLVFDSARQRLVGNVRVAAVYLDGAGGVGSSAIAKLLQGTIDKRFNPLEILTLDKLAFTLPVPQVGSIKARAVGSRHEVEAGVLTVRVTYQFVKG